MVQYLENPYCVFTPLEPIDYSVKKIIYSTSLFKMNAGGYKEFKHYLDGLKKFNDLIQDEKDKIVRLFIDDTIFDDKEIMEFLYGLNKMSIIRYSCNPFLVYDTNGKGKHHVGVFGTLVRMFPLFDFKNNDSKRTFIIDADDGIVTHKEVNYICDILDKQGLSEKMYVILKGWYFTNHIIQFNTVQYNGKSIYLPYVWASFIIGLKLLPRELMIGFLNITEKYVSTNPPPKKILSKHFINKNRARVKCEKNICYGIDEYFLNDVVIPVLINEKYPLSFEIYFSISDFYLRRHPTSSFMYTSQIPPKKYKAIFMEYAKKMGLEKYSFDEISKQFEDLESHEVVGPIGHNVVATKFISDYGKKLMPLMSMIRSKNDNRIYDKSIVSSYFYFDYKKYAKLQLIRFFNFKHPDIITSSVTYE